ncbi:lysoplasmalogenase [Pseudomonas sp. SbB1]|uniref:YhhN family protein n=1 Tax=Pseudomonas putida (strain GB-1) TaxID=76869 RepID=B0KMX7_PSEPG|nr:MULTISPECIES: lysoplasmalogenase [Pseudomonas]ABY99581.1 YhhN family protein [Pseudomonas putida GB-1]MBP0707195.1 lysoplasmalogenase [Pseudomonas sp. T34]MCK2186635.1 lysoplasmalogenase [Pseudomonas sp. MB04B]MDD2083258.1 lysoplasmalogenase [Pseudomonas putida]MDD2093840.1 lysoplasmalogenase [Pseudomonas putida]
MPRPSHLMILALAATALYLYALASNNTLLALLAKPVPALALIAWLRGAPATPYGKWISIGLGFSVIGDILLAVPADLFVFGLAAFLCAHLAYLRAYCGVTLRPALPALIASAITGIVLLGVLASHGLGPLLIPVALYALAISAMLWRALACGGMAALGACLFVLSDSLIGIDRFVSPFAATPYLIILTYWLGQWAIASSASHRSNDKVLTQSGAHDASSC